jgi:hypothetical protein
MKFKMFEIIRRLLRKKEKIEPPDTRAYIKINDVAKENGIYDDENKFIELHRYGRIEKRKYSDADVETLREQGIPVIEEEYSDDYEFVNSDIGGGVEYKR